MASGRVASLEGGVIDVVSMREVGRSAILEVLARHEGPKVLILDQTMGGLLNHVLPEGPKLLKEMGVIHVMELGAQVAPPPGVAAAASHTVYLVRASASGAKAVAAQVLRRVEGGGSGAAATAAAGLKAGSKPLATKNWVYFVPARTLMCEQVLRDEGVFHLLADVSECQLNFIPFECDLFSLEMPGASADTVAQSLVTLQAMFGIIPLVKVWGEKSREALDRSMRTRKEQWDDEAAQVVSEIDALVMLDRSVDWVSPLVTPLTYEGLIDEVFGIANGYVKLDASMLDQDSDSADANAQGDPHAKVSVPLNSRDPLFETTRDYNIAQLGPFLQEKAKEIRESYNKFRGKRDQSINQIHDFVKKIPGLSQGYKSLNQHINIAEVIKRKTDSPQFRRKWEMERSMLEGESCYDFIDECVMNGDDPLEALRLICLQSLTKGGISSGKYESLRRDFIQAYGFEWLPTLASLEKVGLLQKGGLGWVDSGSSWAILRKSLGLINDSLDVFQPNDISYVSSGYAPLSARLVEEAAATWGHPGQSSVADYQRNLRTPSLGVTQRRDRCETLSEALKNNLQGLHGGAGNNATSFSSTKSTTKKKVMLVYYTGGVSYIEIAALRFLSRKPDFPYHILIATTCIVNGSRLIEQIAPKQRNSLKMIAAQ